MTSMTMLIAFLLALVDPSQTYQLTVIGGSGSGRYACGSTVLIVGEKTRGHEVFSEWANPKWDGTGIDRVHRRKARLTMPCHDVTVEARFTGPAKRKS